MGGDVGDAVLPVIKNWVVISAQQWSSASEPPPLAPCNYQHQLWCATSNYCVTGSKSPLVRETKQSAADMRNNVQGC